MNNENLEVMYFHGKSIDGCRFTISGRIEGDDLILGIAICSEKEHFNKAIGRTISSGRCLSQRPGNLGKTRNSLYADGVGDGYRSERGGFPEHYFVGKEIQVFTNYVKNFNHFTKRELQREFRLNRK